MKFKNKKQIYRAVKASFIEQKAREFSFRKCMDYEFMVWTSINGAVDDRCEKCFHLYPFQIEEDLSKARSQTRVPYGQCAESLTCRRVYTISNGKEKNGRRQGTN
jgi:hypothetical protein